MINKTLYDISKSFAYNFNTGPQWSYDIPHIEKPLHLKTKLFDYTINSPLGIPACPLMTSKGIALLSKLGFDVFTYKTVRNTHFEAHPTPNICYISCNKQLNYKEIETTITQKKSPPQNLENIAVANSFGNASFEWPIMQEDINKARSFLSSGQLLIVSVFGTEQKNRSMIDDFIYTAQLAQEAGAQCIELNLSCPNLKNNKPMYHDTTLISELCKKTTNIVSVPVIIKVGYLEHQPDIKSIVLAAAKAGVRGVCGINTIPMKILKEEKPFFGKNRETSGISGNPIRSIALDFVKKVHSVVTQEKVDFELLATGGITMPEHFNYFLDAGAVIAMSATGTMWNPLLGYEYHLKQVNPLQSPQKNSYDIKKGISIKNLVSH